MTHKLQSNPQKTPHYSFNASRNFRRWLGEQRGSLAFSTYQLGLLFLIGMGQDGRLTRKTHRLSRCMGLHVDADKIWAASLHQIWRFSQYSGFTAQAQGVERVYRPRVAHVTGDIDIHEIAEDSNGRLIFVNTLHSCLATLSDDLSFEPLWKPPFISKLAAEDRCHMNGLAMRDGQPAFVSAVSQTDVADGWREHRRNGGVVIDLDSNEIAGHGLSMPHSPRWHRGRLWVLNSGNGGFGFIDPDTGLFEEVCFCPGYARGLTFSGRYAIIGLSKPRRVDAFGGLGLGDRLAAAKVSARCGLIVVDLDSGDICEWMTLEGDVVELFDVRFLHGVLRPSIEGDPLRNASALLAPGGQIADGPFPRG